MGYYNIIVEFENLFHLVLCESTQSLCEDSLADEHLHFKLLCMPVSTFVLNSRASLIMDAAILDYILIQH